ncbi:hypothetical protein NM688_g6556 [Phlebia brevispora]|uniref:Uncharacterized protein n=1 Tax=Phlebia brevispora TaxID=194682 RepID=A0ACC1SEP6_9APHY|nr:hypothetical protein NM688_g6556 [Phlebia brevispora]
MPSQPLQANGSDEQLWPVETTQERSFWEAAISLVEGEDYDGEESAGKATVFHTSHHAASSSTASAGRQKTPPSLASTHRPLKRTDTLESHPDLNPSPEKKLILHTSSDDVFWQEFPSDELGTEEEAELEAVEALISDGESEDEGELEPGPPRTQESFDFSVTHSRNTSMTSLSTGDSINVRKRTLEEMDPVTVQSCPTTPSKSRRRSISDHASNYTRSISHDTGLAAGPSKLFSDAPVEPRTPRHSTAKMPTTPECGWEKCDSHAKHSSHKARAEEEYRPSGESSPSPSRKAKAPETSDESARRPEPEFAERDRKGKSVDVRGLALSADAELPHAMNTESFQIIASDRRVQALMDKHQLAWGVQYEIARGVANERWSWEHVTEEVVRKLKGTNKESACRVAYALTGKNSQTVPSSNLWIELDREEAAIIEHEHRGLGLQGEWQGEQNWFGGKIQQLARLVEPKNDGEQPRIVLEKMQMTRSHRFGRFVGSRRLLQLKLPKNGSPQYLGFLEHKFVLCGRVFISLPSKEGKSYLLEVNEDYERSAEVPGDECRMSLEDFVAWHNPMEFNRNQPVAKWATRFDLGTSNTVPALRFEPENIEIIDDLYAKNSGKHPSTEQTLTDGCGLINSAALKAISKNLGYSERPTAVQGRIYGSKGLWLRHPLDNSTEPKIWIRHSQLKIKFGPPAKHAIPGLNPAQYIFDLVAPSDITTPTRLSRHTIINLAHNGVPALAFEDMMRAGLEKEITPLMTWEGPNAMELLWNAVNKITNTTNGLMQETANGLQRALGLSRRRDLGHEDGEGETYEDGDSYSRYLPGGKPIARGELCLKMLQVGFSPARELFLYEELRKVMRAKVDKDIKGYHIPVYSSVEAFIAPDPLGILKEGEIAFTASKPIRDLEAEDRFTLTGDVLIYRNPARLPSDIQKVRVKAVYHLELVRYTDVILLPTKGARSLASLLAGGDLDGDVAVCIYDPSLVVPFSNPLITSQSPNLRDNFEPDGKILRVEAVYETLSRSSPSQARLTLQKCLLSGLSDSKIGLYSKFHEVAIYMYGYDSQKSIRIADIFNCLLDSRKTGLKLKQDIYQQDRQKYGSFELPDCLNEGESQDIEQRLPIRRRVRGKFILDALMEAGDKLLNDLLVRYDKLQKPEDIRHEYMMKPYTNAASVQDLSAEIRVVEVFVRRLFDRWRTIQHEVDAQIKKASDDMKSKKSGKVDLGKKLRFRKTKELASDFVKGPSEEETSTLRKIGCLDTVSAAYAYTLRPIFAYNMAFRALCAIKAEGKNPVVFTQDFAAWMSMRSSAVRLLSQGASYGNNDDDEHLW